MGAYQPEFHELLIVALDPPEQYCFLNIFFIFINIYATAMDTQIANTKYTLYV